MRLAATLAFCLAAGLAPEAPDAKEFRWATTTDPATLDPHAQNSAPVLSFLNNVYEGLVRRDRDMKIEPSLATSWEQIGDGEGWRFHLREGVTFQDGAAFDAEDVLFSYERASSDEADTASWFAPVSEVTIVDPLTIDFRTTAPNPIFPGSIANFMIMDKGWAEKNEAARPNRETGNYATLNANGTGPFRILSREPGLQTMLEPNPDWWGEARHNITKASHKPIKNPATALASLVSGAVDFIEPVPIQDVEALRKRDGVKVIEGVEARVMMLGFNQHPERRVGDLDANPFADPRVRRAVAHAISLDAITTVILRGAAEPASQLVSPGMRGYSEAHAERPEFDADTAEALLAEAGYPDGFEFSFKCPNDRYINDEEVCQAIVAMLAKVGLTASLDAMPVAQYWPTLREGDFDMYLLGWSPGTFDAEHPLRFLAATPDAEGRLGTWNFGGYSNPRIDELLPLIQSEVDEEKRQAMLDEAAGILQEDAAYATLYVQPLLWGARDNIELVQRADNFFILRWVRVN